MSWCIEYVGHDDEVYSFGFNSTFVSELYFMETIESRNKCMWVRKHVLIVSLHGLLEVNKFVMTDGFEH